MAKAQYIGVNGVARKVTKDYIGVSGVARKVKSGYIGVGGVARKFFPGEAQVFILEVRNADLCAYSVRGPQIHYYGSAKLQTFEVPEGSRIYLSNEKDMPEAPFPNGHVESFIGWTDYTFDPSFPFEFSGIVTQDCSVELAWGAEVLTVLSVNSLAREI